MTMNKINEKHLGWAEHPEGGKDHYYIMEEGVFIISICGATKSYTYTDRCFMEETPSTDSDNQCKKCLKKIKQFENGEKIEIKVDGLFL